MMSQGASFLLKIRSGTSQLIVLFMGAVAITFFVATGNVMAEMKFQSPQSPPAEEAPTEAPTPTPPPPEPTSIPTQPPVEQPPPEPEETESEAEVAEPTMTPEPPTPSESESLEEAPVLAPTPTQPTMPTATPSPRQPIRGSDRPISIEAEEESDNSNFIVDQAELIDSMVISGAYVWLGCGIIMMLIVPLFLLLLYIRGRSKIISEDSF